MRGEAPSEDAISTEFDDVLQRLPEDLTTDDRYRQVITVLVREEGRCQTATLLRSLAEQQPDGTETGRNQYRTLHLWLHRAAIPTLRALGIASYEEDTGQLTLTPAED